MVHPSTRERAPATVFIVMFFSGINKSKGTTMLMLLKQEEKKIDTFLQKGTNNRKQNVVKSFTKVCLRLSFPCLGMPHGGSSIQPDAFKSILGMVRL